MKNILKHIFGNLRAKSFNKYLASNLIEIGISEKFNFEIFLILIFHIITMIKSNNWPKTLLELEEKIKKFHFIFDKQCNMSIIFQYQVT